MKAIIFFVFAFFLFFSKVTASESLSHGYFSLESSPISSKSTNYILISNGCSFLQGVENGIESVICKHPFSNSLAEAEPNDPEWEKMIATSISNMKGANNKFWIHFFAVCALSLMGIVTLGAICIKVKKRYFS